MKNYGFARATNGHYLLSVGDFGSLQHVVEIPEDFKMPHGREAVVILHAAAEQLKSAGETHGGARGRSGERAGVQTMPELRTLDAGLPEPAGRGPGDDRGQRDGEADAPEGGSAAEECYAAQGASEAGKAGGAGQRLDGGLVHCLGDDRGRDQDHPEAPGEDSEGRGQAEGDAGTDGILGGLSEPLGDVLQRGGAQPGVHDGLEDANIPVEEVLVAAQGQERGGGHAAGQVEAEPAVVGHAAQPGGGLGVGALRSHAAEAELSRSVGPHVKGQHMQRGEIQALKRGSRKAMEVQEALVNLGKADGRYVVLEIYAGKANLTRVANTYHQDTWGGLALVDIL